MPTALQRALIASAGAVSSYSRARIAAIEEKQKRQQQQIENARADRGLDLETARLQFAIEKENAAMRQWANDMKLRLKNYKEVVRHNQEVERLTGELRDIQATGAAADVLKAQGALQQNEVETRLKLNDDAIKLREEQVKQLTDDPNNYVPRVDSEGKPQPVDVSVDPLKREVQNQIIELTSTQSMTALVDTLYQAATKAQTQSEASTESQSSGARVLSSQGKPLVPIQEEINRLKAERRKMNVGNP